MTKKETEKAHAAGVAFAQLPDANLPDEALEDPLSACPFPPDDPQRIEWLKGLQEGIDTKRKVGPSLTKEINDAISISEKVIKA